MTKSRFERFASCIRTGAEILDFSNAAFCPGKAAMRDVVVDSISLLQDIETAAAVPPRNAAIPTVSRGSPSPAPLRSAGFSGAKSAERGAYAAAGAERAIARGPNA